MTLFDAAPTSGADIDGDYRYHLWRDLDPSPSRILLWVMLNPSTADHATDDPTIRRVIGFTRREGFDRLEVVNLYAYRATDPRHLELTDDPVGPRNDDAIRAAVGRCEMVMVAWGAPKLPCRDSRRVLGVVPLLATRPLRCLGTTAVGAPRHPLYVRGDTPMVAWP